MEPNAQIKNIFTSLRQESKFSFAEGDESILSSSSEINVSLQRVEEKLLKREVTVSDVFIAYAIAVMGVCDAGMIQTYLAYYSNVYPKKIVPAGINKSVLKERLNTLCRSGMVRQVCVCSEGKGKAAPKLMCYCISEYGAQAVKRVLEVESLKYDPWLSACSTPEFLKRAQASFAMLPFLSTKNFSRAFFFGEKDDVLVKVKRSIYGRLEFNTADNKRYMIFVEPACFRFNNMIRTEAELITEFSYRLKMLSNVVLGYVDPLVDKTTGRVGQKRYENVFVLFSVEDSAGLEKLATMIQKNCIKLLPYARFTSEKILHNNKMDLTKSILRFDVDPIKKVHVPVVDNIAELYS